MLKTGGTMLKQGVQCSNKGYNAQNRGTMLKQGVQCSTRRVQCLKQRVQYSKHSSNRWVQCLKQRVQIFVRISQNFAKNAKTKRNRKKKICEKYICEYNFRELLLIPNFFAKSSHVCEKYICEYNFGELFLIPNFFHEIFAFLHFLFRENFDFFRKTD